VRVLNIISCGYRATVEEQDDTIVWLSHALKRAGADVDVLLRGSAANYVVQGQSVAPAAFGARVQRHAPDVLGQVAQLIESGVEVLVLDDDLKRRGLAKAPRLGGCKLVAAANLPGLLNGYDRVWHW
jgi:hypothetical protein